MIATAKKLQDKFLLTMPVFGVNKNDNGKWIIWHSSILNFADDFGNGKMEYLTKNGLINTTVSELEGQGYIKTYKIEDICLENLMRDWRRKHNDYSLTFEVDNTIETGEIITSNFSPVKIMVLKSEQTIKIKLIFE